MKRTTLLVMVIGFGLALTPAAQAWVSYLDFNDSMLPPDPPWTEYFNEGGFAFVDLGGGNFALRLDSPDHSAQNPAAGTYYNEYYVTNIPPDPTLLEFYEPVAAARFRLHSFTPTGQENILAPSTSIASPTITLVDGHYWLWSFLSNPAQRPILDLGPAVADEFHEVYIMPTIEGIDDMTGVPNAGGAKVWWDGHIVFNGPVDHGGNVFQGGYVEFGSGTYWQVNAGTEVDFDWVGFGDVNDFPRVPGDYNGNGVVDGADYVVWRKNKGITSGATFAQGDGDQDGDVDDDDYNFWRARFGNTSGSGSALGSSAVPESASVSLLLVAVLALALRRAR